jgi:hypothetical protein
MLRLNFRGDKQGFIVRLLSPIGSYPAETFVGTDERMIIGSDLCFLMTKSRPNDSFSEIDGLDPVEIPLLGTMLLCAEKGEPRICPYPADTTLHLYSRSDHELTDEIVDEGRRLLLAATCRRRRRGDWPTSTIHRPPICGGRAYDLIMGAERISSRERLLPMVKASGPLFFRGLALLVKANMALQYPEFWEAAGIFLWIAMDGAQSIILERLREAGSKNPTSKDAASYVYEAYGIEESDWEYFFEDDYQTRIRFIHPGNRFGAEARPCATADDILELNENLIDLYFFLLTGIPRDIQADS